MAKKKDKTRNAGDVERKKEKAKQLQKNKQDRANQKLIHKIKNDPERYNRELQKLNDLLLQKRIDNVQKKELQDLTRVKSHIDAALEANRQRELISEDRQGQVESGNLAELAAQAREQRRRQGDVTMADHFDGVVLPGGKKTKERDEDGSSYEYYSYSDEEISPRWQDQPSSYEEYSDPLPPEDTPPLVMPAPKPTVVPPPTPVTQMRPHVSATSAHVPIKPSRPLFAPRSVLLNKKQSNPLALGGFAEPVKAESLVGVNVSAVDDAFGGVMTIPGITSHSGSNIATGALSRLKRKKITEKVPVSSSVTLECHGDQKDTSQQVLPSSISSLGLGGGEEGHPQPRKNEADLDALFQSFLK